MEAPNVRLKPSEKAKMLYFPVYLHLCIYRQDTIHVVQIRLSGASTSKELYDKALDLTFLIISQGNIDS